jgi:NIMA (never in mitosis gene a)-related kinase
MNIFLTKDNHIKIGDFGVSKKLNNNIYAYTFIGTPYYLSPEMCRNKAYDEKTDMWSLGCILYELITFKKPFESTSQMGIFMKILSDPPAPLEKTIKGTYSHKLLNLIYFLLEKNPIKRFSMQQVFNYGIFKILNSKKSNKNIIKNENININDNNKFVKEKSSQKIMVNSGPVRPERKDNNDSKRIRMNPSNKNQSQTLVNIFLIFCI